MDIDRIELTNMMDLQFSSWKVPHFEKLVGLLFIAYPSP